MPPKLSKRKLAKLKATAKLSLTVQTMEDYQKLVLAGKAVDLEKEEKNQFVTLRKRNTILDKNFLLMGTDDNHEVLRAVERSTHEAQDHHPIPLRDMSE